MGNLFFLNPFLPPSMFALETLIPIFNLTLVTMADGMKLQQSMQESSVPGTQNTENGVKMEDCLPYPPVSPERPALWGEQQWKSTLSKEELKQCCARCKEIEHSNQHCIRFRWGSRSGDASGLATGQRNISMSRCGRRGHNRRTCHGPVFY